MSRFSSAFAERAQLARRMLRDPQTSRGDKLLLFGLLCYLATPIDLIPDFIPVIGLLDDVVIAALVLRRVTRHARQVTPE